MSTAVDSSETCHKLTVTLDAPAARKARPRLITPSALLILPLPVLQAESTTDSELSFNLRISDIDRNIWLGATPSYESTRAGSLMFVSTGNTPCVAKCTNRNLDRS